VPTASRASDGTRFAADNQQKRTRRTMGAAGCKVGEVSNEGPNISIGRLFPNAPFVSGFTFLQMFRDNEPDFLQALPGSHSYLCL
jgi:hypothetical protein